MIWSDRITSPALILDKDRCLANIRRMADKASRSGVRFRPHFKTHQSAAVGEWFRPLGVDAITVSSVSMGMYFANHGWKDITLAFLVNVREIKAINDLASRIHLELLVESSETIRFLSHNLESPVGLWLKADVGAHRTGIPVEDHAIFLSLFKEAERSNRMEPLGILTHAGQTYHADSVDGVKKIYQVATSQLSTLKNFLRNSGFPNVKISWGDTPSCSLVDDLSNVDEIRPGNFALFDFSQFRIGSCREEDIAAVVACPVVSIHEDRNEVVVHGGAIHLSKERLDDDGKCSYGAVAFPTPTEWSRSIPGAFVNSVSQEHGIISVPKESLSRIKVGDLLIILPVHSCLVVDLFSQYLGLDGEVIPTMRGDPL